MSTPQTLSRKPSLSRFGSSSLSNCVAHLPTPIGTFLSVVSSTLLSSQSTPDLNSNSLQLTEDQLAYQSYYSQQQQNQQQHSSLHSQVHSLPQQPGYRTPPTQMQLSTQCQSCDARVSVEVPSWMTEAMNKRNSSFEVQGNGLNDNYVRNNEVRRGSWRESIVSGIITIAKAVKSSPIPPFLASCFKSLIVFMLYLDRLFLIHQRLAIMFSIMLEGMVEIEKEVGFFRSLGEGLSVFWEAFIKGTIALAKPDITPSTQPQPHQSQAQHHSSGTTSPFYTSYRPPSPPQTASSSTTNLHSLNFTANNSHSYQQQQLQHQLPHSHTYPNSHTPYEGYSPNSPPFTHSSTFTNPFASPSNSNSLSPRPSLRRGTTPSLPLLLASSSSSHLIPTSHSNGSLNSNTTTSSSINTFLIPPTPSSTPIRSPPPPDYAFVTRSPIDLSLSSTNENLVMGSSAISIGGSTLGRRNSFKRTRSKSEEYRTLVATSSTGEVQFENENEGDIIGKGWGNRIAGAVGRGLGR